MGSKKSIFEEISRNICTPNGKKKNTKEREQRQSFPSPTAYPNHWIHKTLPSPLDLKSL